MPIDRFIARQLDDHIAVVHRYLARRVGAQAAEDLTADVMCSAIAGAHTYDPARGPVVAWLMGIATHALSRHWRAERQQLEALDRLGVDPLRRATVASPGHHAAESDEMRTVAEAGMMLGPYSENAETTACGVGERVDNGFWKCRVVIWRIVIDEEDFIVIVVQDFRRRAGEGADRE